MKRKSVKRLLLDRETLAHLNRPDLSQAVGAISQGTTCGGYCTAYCTFSVDTNCMYTTHTEGTDCCQ